MNPKLVTMLRRKTDPRETVAILASRSATTRLLGLWIRLIFFAASAMPASAQTSLTNLEGKKIIMTISAYHPDTGTVDLVGVNGTAYQVPMGSLNLESKIKVIGSSAGKQALGELDRPYRTFSTLIILWILAIPLVLLGFIGFYFGAAMISGSWSFATHGLAYLKAFLVSCPFRALQFFWCGIFTDSAPLHVQLIELGIAIFEIVVVILVFKSHYRFASLGRSAALWFVSILISAVVIFVVLMALLIVAQMSGIPAEPLNSLFTNQILKPMGLM